MPRLVIQFLVPSITHSSPSLDRAGDHPARIGAGLGLGQRERRRPLAARAARQEALLELLGAEQLDRQRAELLDHQDQRGRRARLGDLLDRHVEHQRAGAGAAVLGLERQPEDVLLGQQLAQVVRVVRLLVDLGRPRRDPLAARSRGSCRGSRGAPAGSCTARTARTCCAWMLDDRASGRTRRGASGGRLRPARGGRAGPLASPEGGGRCSPPSAVAGSRVEPARTGARRRRRAVVAAVSNAQARRPRCTCARRWRRS